MDKIKITRIAQIILSIFKMKLEGSPSKEFFVGELKSAGILSLRECELLEEKIFDGILDIGAEWFFENFPSLSSMEKCECNEDGCNGWRLKDEEEKESQKVALNH
jgi:hypothetical protein